MQFFLPHSLVLFNVWFAQHCFCFVVFSLLYDVYWGRRLVCTGSWCYCTPGVQSWSISVWSLLTDNVRHETSECTHRADILPESFWTKPTCKLSIEKCCHLMRSLCVCCGFILLTCNSMLSLTFMSFLLWSTKNMKWTIETGAINYHHSTPSFINRPLSPLDPTPAISILTVSCLRHLHYAELVVLPTLYSQLCTRCTLCTSLFIVWCESLNVICKGISQNLWKAVSSC